MLDKPQVAVALVGAKDASHLDETLDIFRVKARCRRPPADRGAGRLGARRAVGDCYDGSSATRGGMHKSIMQMNQNMHGAPEKIDMMAPDLKTTRG